MAMISKLDLRRLISKRKKSTRSNYSYSLKDGPLSIAHKCLVSTSNLVNGKFVGSSLTPLTELN